MIVKINKCLATRYLKDKMFRVASPDTQIKYFQRLVNMPNLPSTWASQDTKRVCHLWPRGVEVQVPEKDEPDLHQRVNVTAHTGGAENRGGFGAPGTCSQVGVLRG